VLLEPGDPVLRGLVAEVAWRAERERATEGDAAARKRVSRGYAAAAMTAAAEGRKAEARSLADSALALWEDNGDAYLARAWSGSGDLQAERLDIVRAVRAYRRQAREDTAFENKGGFALALATGACQRLLRLAPPPEAPSLLRETTLQQILDEAQQALDEAREAARLSPELPLAPAVELWARAERLNVHRMSGRDTDAAAARRLADGAMALFPEFGLLRFARAKLALAEGQAEEAETELNEALRLEPTLSLAYAARAEARLALGRCADARRDAKQAGAHDMPLAEAKAAAVAACR
jgi:tetratricopeptide (TPR) repeat protein